MQDWSSLSVCAAASGDEDGDDVDGAAVWLRPLCEAARRRAGARLRGGTRRAGRRQQYPSGK